MIKFNEKSALFIFITFIFFLSSCGMPKVNSDLPINSNKQLTENTESIINTENNNSLNFLKLEVKPNKLAAGRSHTVVVKDDGTVWAWGANFAKQLGKNEFSFITNIPVQVNGLTDIVSVSSSYDSIAALKKDGTVWVWGRSNYGQAEDNNSITRSILPTQVIELTDIVQISVSDENILALKKDGTVWAWGNNSSGEVGDGTNNKKNIPVKVKELTNVIEVISKNGCSIAIKSDGTVWTWGGYIIEQIEDDIYTDSLTPIQVKGLTDVESLKISSWNNMIAFKKNGTIWSRTNLFHENGNMVLYGKLVEFANPSNNSEFKNLSGIENVSMRIGYIEFLKKDGTLWRCDMYESYTDVIDNERCIQINLTKSNELSGFIDIATGLDHTVALKNDGTVWAWGFNQDGMLGDGTFNESWFPTKSLISLKGGFAEEKELTINKLKFQSGKISASMYHTAVIKENGTVWTWGANFAGQLGDGTTKDSPTPIQVKDLTDVIAVSASADNTIALKKDGTVWAWGDNSCGELGDGTTKNKKTPVQVKNLNDVVAISADSEYTLAVKKDGTVWAWGNNYSGLLGDGTNSNSSFPVQVKGLKDVIGITTSYFNAFALKKDGTVWTWGKYCIEQILLVSTTESITPIKIDGLSDVVSIKESMGHIIALREDGTAWEYSPITGYGDIVKINNQTDSTIDFEKLTGFVQFALTRDSGLALKEDGTLWRWWIYSSSQFGNNTEQNLGIYLEPISVLNNIVEISMGQNHAVALKEDGTLWVWGLNDSGALGNGTFHDTVIPTEFLINLKN